MSWLGDWLDARRAWPWPEDIPDRFELPWWEQSAPAAPLYEAYRKDALARADAELRVLTHVQFGSAVKAHANPDGSAAFKQAKGRAVSEGGVETDVRVYRGLTLRTRQERLEHYVRLSAMLPIQRRLEADAEARHMAETHHPDGICLHSASTTTVAAVRAQAEAEARDAGLLDPERVTAEVERRYGPWLHWRPGDPNPSLAALSPEERDERARTSTKVEAVAAQLRALEGPGQGEGW